MRLAVLFGGAVAVKPWRSTRGQARVRGAQHSIPHALRTKWPMHEPVVMREQLRRVSSGTCLQEYAHCGWAWFFCPRAQTRRSSRTVKSSMA